VGVVAPRDCAWTIQGAAARAASIKKQVIVRGGELVRQGEETGPQKPADGNKLPAKRVTPRGNCA